MAKYIMFNTNQRMKANNDFEKDFYKLMNNSVFGKTMENVRRRVNIKLVNDEKKFKKLVKQCNYQSFKPFDNNLRAVHMGKTKIYLNKPIYCGFSILDLSKITMYDFHYNYMLNKYNNIHLLFTDTDSLCYEIITNDDVYMNIKNDIHLFDTSNYPTNHPCFTNDNKAVLGKFKDETAGIPIIEFIGHRSKCYSILLDNEKVKNTAKGVKKSVKENYLSHELYKQCLLNNKIYPINQNLIRSNNHKIYSISQDKTGLSPYDDKRYLYDNIYSYAYGHYKINNLC